LKPYFQLLPPLSTTIVLFVVCYLQFASLEYSMWLPDIYVTIILLSLSFLISAHLPHRIDHHPYASCTPPDYTDESRCFITEWHEYNITLYCFPLQASPFHKRASREHGTYCSLFVTDRHMFHLFHLRSHYQFRNGAATVVLLFNCSTINTAWHEVYAISNNSSTA